MSPTEAKKPTAWLSQALDLVAGIRGILLLAGGLLAGSGGTWVMADAGVSRAESTAIADSTARVRVQAATDSLGGEIAGLKAENRAAFGALMDAIPAFKEAVRARGQANADARQKKAESDQLLENLNGGTP